MHVDPRENPVWRRFHKLRQRPAATVLQYVNEMEAMLRKCGYRQDVGEALAKDRLVVGLRDQGLRDELGAVMDRPGGVSYEYLRFHAIRMDGGDPGYEEPPVRPPPHPPTWVDEDEENRPPPADRRQPCEERLLQVLRGAQENNCQRLRGGYEQPEGQGGYEENSWPRQRGGCEQPVGQGGYEENNWQRQRGGCEQPEGQGGYENSWQRQRGGRIGCEQLEGQGGYEENSWQRQRGGRIGCEQPENGWHDDGGRRQETWPDNDNHLHREREPLCRQNPWPEQRVGGILQDPPRQRAPWQNPRDTQQGMTYEEWGRGPPDRPAPAGPRDQQRRYEDGENHPPPADRWLRQEQCSRANTWQGVQPQPPQRGLWQDPQQGRGWGWGPQERPADMPLSRRKNPFF